MLFLIDENLPFSIGESFRQKGHEIASASKIPELRTQPDEVLFNYAVKYRAIIITRDLGYANPARFELSRLQGLIVIRFPNVISMQALCREIARLTEQLAEADFKNLLIIEPSHIRSRHL